MMLVKYGNTIDSTTILTPTPDCDPGAVDRLEAFWLGSGSFTHRRFSLVPSFKTQIEVRGHSAWLYFECHDVGDYDLDTRFIAGYTFLAGTVRRNGSHWVFWDMTAGSSYPLSVDDYYFP